MVPTSWVLRLYGPYFLGIETVNGPYFLGIETVYGPYFLGIETIWSLLLGY